jgi:hypothetical protein
MTSATSQSEKSPLEEEVESTPAPFSTTPAGAPKGGMPGPGHRLRPVDTPSSHALTAVGLAKLCINTCHRVSARAGTEALGCVPEREGAKAAAAPWEVEVPWRCTKMRPCQPPCQGPTQLDVPTPGSALADTMRPLLGPDMRATMRIAQGKSMGMGVRRLRVAVLGLDMPTPSW